MTGRHHETWIYFDGNAVSALWDWHTKVTKEGNTGDSRSNSPFANIVLSDFSLDELITIPVGNAYKKHLLLLTIFPDIPVLLPLGAVDLEAADRDRASLLRKPGFLASVASLRARALLGDPTAVNSLRQDLATKTERIDSDIKSARSSQYTPKGQRIELRQAVALAVDESDLHPESSSSDFFGLCRKLYEFDIARLIDRPASTRKGAKRRLNQQIDYYHLSYVPFVDGFVTDDKTLRTTAQALCEQFRPSVEVYSVDEYHRSWIRDRLIAN